MNMLTYTTTAVLADLYLGEFQKKGLPEFKHMGKLVPESKTSKHHQPTVD